METVGWFKHPSCRFNLFEDTDADGDPTNDKYLRKDDNCPYPGGTGTYTREERLSRPHFWASRRIGDYFINNRLMAPQMPTPPDPEDSSYDPAMNPSAEVDFEADLATYQADRQTYDAGRAEWEHCGTSGGQMPCGAVTLPSVDVETLRRWVAGSKPYTLGDPHIKTVDGTSYDFQAAGGRSAQGRKRLRIDGQVTPLPTRELILANGSRIIRTGAESFKVDIPGGTSVEVTPFWTDYLSVHFGSARATDGLGSKIPTGEWLPRMSNGRTLGPRPEDIGTRYKMLCGEFGRSWEVNPTNSLFDYDEGMGLEDFEVPGWPRGHNPQSCALPDQHPEDQGDPPAPLDRATAEAACSSIADPEIRQHCVDDAVALGDAAIAEDYFATVRAMMNEPPKAATPTTPEAYATLPAQDIRFSWTEAFDRCIAARTACVVVAQP